jgi:hypothetical protein
MSQQERKAQESEVVRRLTVGAGAAALGLAWYFTASAMTAVPLAFGAQPADDGQPASWAEQFDDRVFVRTVHMPAMRGPAAGVKAGGTIAGSSGQAIPAGGQTATTAPTGRASTSSGQSSASAPSAPAAVTMTVQPAPARAATPAPAPAPAAATGGSTPAK